MHPRPGTSKVLASAGCYAAGRFLVNACFSIFAAVETAAQVVDAALRPAGRGGATDASQSLREPAPVAVYLETV